MDNFWTTFFYIVVMLAVIFGAYFTTRFISGKSSKLLKSRHIHLLDRMPLGKDKNIVLIKVGDQNILVGVTNQSINNLGEISGESLNAENVQTQGPRKGFAEQFREFISNAKDAPDNLRKARMQVKSKPQYDSEDNDDILDRMDEAMQRRRDRMNDKSGGEEE